MGDFVNCVPEVFLCSVESSRSNPKPGQFSVPHSLALVPHLGQLCVADRENGRIQCFTTDTKEFVREIKHASFGRNVFAISYISGTSSLFFVYFLSCYTLSLQIICLVLICPFYELFFLLRD